MGTPIHLTVDTKLTDSRMGVRAYIGAPMGVPGATVGTVFAPVPFEPVYRDTERIGLQALMKTVPAEDSMATLGTDLEHVSAGIDRLDSMLEEVLQYVNRVISGEVEGDQRIGRYLLDTVAAVPKVEPSEFEKSFNSSLQDLLMVVYLANLTRSQVALQET